MTPLTPLTPLTLNPGDIISNRYRLIQLIGVGGFAEVWKVEDIEQMENTGKGKYFALKIFKRQDDSTRINRSFERAYGILSRLKHSHIVGLHGRGTHEDTPYLVLDYCDGGDLIRLLEKRNQEGKYFTEQELGTIMGQMAEALNKMHNERPRVIHSDIKPDNILILKKGEEHYKLADFGVSEVLGRTRKRTQRLPSRITQARNQDTNQRGATIYITPEYAAPELFDKPSPHPDPSQDIFSLAITIYELAYGKLPGKPDTEGRHLFRRKFKKRIQMTPAK